MLITDSTRPRLIGNEIWGSGHGGIAIAMNADPYLSGNTIRDHAGVGAGFGVLVHHTSLGLAAILPDNVFLRNEGGDVVRQGGQ